MTERNHELDVVLIELEKVGVKKPTIDRSGKHIEVLWWHRGRPRRIYVGKTASDHRAVLNNRALVRKYLREDGYDLAKLPQPTPRVEQAFSPPDPLTDPIPSRLEKVEQELKTVTDMLLAIAPSFNSILNDLDRYKDTNPKKWDVRFFVDSKQLGIALAALYSAGFKPDDIYQLLPVGEQKPAVLPPIIEVDERQPRIRNTTRRHAALMLLKSPKTLSELSIQMNIKILSKEYNCLTTMLAGLKRQGFVEHSERGAPYRLTEKGSTLLEGNGQLP